MSVLIFLRRWLATAAPEHLRRGRIGEAAAKAHLRKVGLKYLAKNYVSEYGEIDLIFRDGNCLVFVEVKTRSSETWTRPASAVRQKKQQRIFRTAVAYLRQLGNPEVSFRFDIVEVILSGGSVAQIRHLANAFTPPRLR